MITQLNQLDLNARYSYADYLLWQFQERVELIRGHIRQMAAPTYQAQLPNVQGDTVGIGFLSGFNLIVDEIFED